MESLTDIINYSTDLISKGGPFAGFALVFLEAFLPVLPLGVFVTLNANAFGFISGILISWLATVCGSYIMYMVFYYASNTFITKVLSTETREKIYAKTAHFKKIKLTNLVLIITLPFTPSCFINLLAGISGITNKKYLIALLIGKSLMIIFWAYIGLNFIESMTNIKALIFLGLMLLIAYILAKLVLKKFKIE